MRIFENIKSLFLCFLIGLSIYLTGSLWFDDYQGLSLVLANLPLNLRETFLADSVEYTKKYSETIVPYKVTIASPDNGKWVLYNDSDDVAEIWNMAKVKFDDIHEKTEVITGNILEWKDLIHRKSVIFEFGDVVDVEVLKLIFPKLKWINQPDFNNVKKIAITKSLDGAVIYVECQINSGDLLYKILLEEEMSGIESFIDGYAHKVADVKYVTLEETGTTKFYSDKLVVPSTDVLFPISNKVDLRDRVRKISVKDYFSQNDAYSPDKFAVLIFKNTDYAQFITESNGYIYINDDKSHIQIETDGTIEYISKAKSEEVTQNSITSDYNAALDFIGNLNIYENFYLLSASKQGDEYEFRFFLSEDGIPLISSNKIIEDDFKAMFQVRVKNGVVRYFKGKLISETLMKNDSLLISNFTKPILDEITLKMKEKQSVTVENIQLGYETDGVGEFYPAWYIEYKVGNESGIIRLKATKK